MARRIMEHLFIPPNEITSGDLLDVSGVRPGSIYKKVDMRLVNEDNVVVFFSSEEYPIALDRRSDGVDILRCV